MQCITKSKRERRAARQGRAHPQKQLDLFYCIFFLAPKRKLPGVVQSVALNMTMSFAAWCRLSKLAHFELAIEDGSFVYLVQHRRGSTDPTGKKAHRMQGLEFGRYGVSSLRDAAFSDLNGRRDLAQGGKLALSAPSRLMKKFAQGADKELRRSSFGREITCPL